MIRQMPHADVIDYLNVSLRYVIIHTLERKPGHLDFSTLGKYVIDMLTIHMSK